MIDVRRRPSRPLLIHTSQSQAANPDYLPSLDDEVINKKTDIGLSYSLSEPEVAVAIERMMELLIKMSPHE